MIGRGVPGDTNLHIGVIGTVRDDSQRRVPKGVARSRQRRARKQSRLSTCSVKWALLNDDVNDQKQLSCAISTPSLLMVFSDMVCAVPTIRCSPMRSRERSNAKFILVDSAQNRACAVEETLDQESLRAAMRKIAVQLHVADARINFPQRRPRRTAVRRDRANCALPELHKIVGVVEHRMLRECRSQSRCVPVSFVHADNPGHLS